MRRIIVFFTAIVLSCGLYAQSFKMTGNLNFLKSESEIGVIFTENGLRIGKMTEADYINKKVSEYNVKRAGRGDKWLAAWQNDKETRFYPKFIELFNKRLKNKQLTIGDGGRYLMIVNTDFIEPGFNKGAARRNIIIDNDNDNVSISVRKADRKNSVVNLTIRFINPNTNEELAVIIVKRASANDFWGTDFDDAYRIQESFGKAGRELAKFLIKKGGL